jgi:hypothetical protein
MKFVLTTVIIYKSGYNEYIRDNAPKQLNKIIDKIDEEDIIEGYTIGLPNSSPVCYDQLWLINIRDEYIPVLIQNINTSSYFALWSCGIYQDENDPEDMELSFDELIDFVHEDWRKGLKKIIQAEYIDKSVIMI